MLSVRPEFAPRLPGRKFFPEVAAGGPPLAKEASRPGEQNLFIQEAGKKVDHQT